jgi:hypothetical protein
LSKLIWAHCRVCEFDWAVAELPIDLHAAAERLQRGSRFCPSCGDTRGALIGRAPAIPAPEEPK